MASTEEQNKENSVWCSTSSIVPEEAAAILTHCRTHPALDQRNNLALCWLTFKPKVADELLLKSM